MQKLAGHVWVHTSLAQLLPEGLLVHEGLLSPRVRVCGFTVEWRTHWTRAMENMLDWPHLPLVHARTIGKGMVGRSELRMDIDSEPFVWGSRIRIAIKGEPQGGLLDFRWPNQMNLSVLSERRFQLLSVSCDPIDAARTRMLVATRRDFLTSPLFDFAFN